MTSVAARAVAARAVAATLIVAMVVAAPCSASADPGRVVVVTEEGVDPGLAKRISKEIRKHRAVLPLQPLPPRTQSPQEVANADRVTAVSRALERARRHEEVAAWDACTKEAGDRLGDATEVLATSGELALLRDLHLQIGACLSLSATPDDAQPHFRKATLLDERAPAKGQHRQEAEVALERARAEVLARQRGLVRIESDPPGAEVWIDGVRATGQTPLEASVRLGTHFVTLRRFRYEPETTQALMQPGSALRIVLATAQRDTLRRQLAEVRSGTRRAPVGELALARAALSGAEELILLQPATGPRRTASARIQVVEPESGTRVRRELVDAAADDETLHATVCTALAAVCPEDEGGIPWYVWPIVGAALTGGSVALGYYLDSRRTTAFCPAGGC